MRSIHDSNGPCIYSLDPTRQPQQNEVKQKVRNKTNVTRESDNVRFTSQDPGEHGVSMYAGNIYNLQGKQIRTSKIERAPKTASKHINTIPG